MPRIKLLPSSLINKIAAGEVIDRPASVVKELVENAIDAMASRIDIYLEEGGRKLIRIVDNGIGMDAEDIALAFQSHATSKIKDADDLFAIHTLGFRGEALPSIGSVSQSSIISRTKGAIHGAEIRINGGVLSEVKECGAPEGTQMEVRELFFNVPVRKKFLKTIPTEMANISEVLTKFSLSYPAVHFTLTHNDRPVFNLPPVQDTADRIAAFFGEELRKQLIPVLLREERFSLCGYVAPPFFDKANARMQFIFLNGRYIRDSAIFRAISEAYHGKLMPRRYPIVFLFLQIDPSEVDVNVHPTKIEVRFRNASAIYHYVLSTLKEGLSRSPVKSMEGLTPIQKLEKDAVKTGDVAVPKKSLWDQFPLKKTEEPRASGEPTKEGFPHSTPPQREVEFTDTCPPEENDNSISTQSQEKDESPQAPHDEHKSPRINDVPLTRETDRRERVYAPEGNNKPRRYFQVHNAYIVEETVDGLNIIDQHALHEIILYHEIEKNVSSSKLPSQRLLIPELVDLSPKDFFSIIGLKEHLGALGIEIDEFGHNTIVIRSFPQMLKRLNGKEFLETLLTEFGDGDVPNGKDKTLNKLISVMACKGAVKAGQRLESQEIGELLEKKRSMSAFTNNCPHGRPTTLHFSLDDLEKQFKRK